MRAGGGADGHDHRSGNCSSAATGNADGSSSKRTGLNRTEGRDDRFRAPLGSMLPKGNPVAPTPVGNQAREYQRWKIQGSRSVATAWQSHAENCRATVPVANPSNDKHGYPQSALTHADFPVRPPNIAKPFINKTLRKVRIDMFSYIICLHYFLWLQYSGWQASGRKTCTQLM